MLSPIPDYLDEILDSCTDASGAVADYIPELARADPERRGLGLAMLDGTLYTSGDSETLFTIQSISKPFAYALALEHRGFDTVLGAVGVEPSGEAFNELSLDEESGRPLNPMINAGAMTTHALLGDPGCGRGTRAELVVAGLSAFAGRQLAVDPATAESEWSTAYRNLAIANMLRSYGVFENRPAEVVRGYIDQCSVLVSVRDLALMATTLAGGGVNPLTGERVVSQKVARHVLGVMMTCGMYDAAGDWMTMVGVPAKSGVSGGIIGVLPGQLGVAAFSPRLDSHGTSVQGAAVFERLSEDMGMHIMNAPEPSRAVIRRDRRFVGDDGRLIRVCSLQGVVGFSGAETVIRALDSSSDPDVFVLDLRRVSSLDRVARNMLTRALARLSEDTRISLLDPDDDLRCAADAHGIRDLGRLPSLEEFAGFDRVPED